MNSIHGGGSGNSLHFTPGNIAGTRVEMKICELCGRTFFRESYSAQAPSRDCDRCIAATGRKRETRCAGAAECAAVC